MYICYYIKYHFSNDLMHLCKFIHFLIITYNHPQAERVFSAKYLLFKLCHECIFRCDTLKEKNKNFFISLERLVQFFFKL